MWIHKIKLPWSFRALPKGKYCNFSFWQIKRACFLYTIHLCYYLEVYVTRILMFVLLFQVMLAVGTKIRILLVSSHQHIYLSHYNRMFKYETWDIAAALMVAFRPGTVKLVFTDLYPQNTCCIRGSLKTVCPVMFV